jgi:ribonuclease HII
MQLPTLKLELDLWKKGFLVVGIDEVGRGSFAGPLVVGATIIKPSLNKTAIEKLLGLGINDSKKLSKTKRETLQKSVQEFIFDIQIEYISVDIINEIGIGKSTTKGFEGAAKKLSAKYKNQKIFFLTDAFSIPTIPKESQLNIIRGDSTSLSIATASILAKVNRDNHMDELSKSFPHYSLSQNKGYGTLTHRNALRLYGPSPIHRKDFISKALKP